jgi:glycosyltransferase involved in cell wall biosynthesis
MHKSQLITFIIPTRARPELLNKCLGSLNSALSNLGQQDLRDFNFEVLVIFNGEAAVELTQFGDLTITSLSIAQQNPSEARNIAIRSKKSAYYYFIDDDTQLPADFLVKICQIFRQNPRIDVFGGPDNCTPEVSVFEKSLEIALRSPLTTQKTNRRHLPSDQQENLNGNERNLILCNLCVKERVFEELGEYFPSDFLRNEENVFLARIDGRVDIRFFPNLFIYHKRRHALKNVFYAASRSGYFRMKMILAGIGKNQFVFLVPMLFLFYLIASVSLFFITYHHELVYPLYLYAVLNLLTSMAGCARSKLFMCLPIVMGYQLFVILSYALGTVAAGLVELRKALTQKFA